MILFCNAVAVAKRLDLGGGFRAAVGDDALQHLDAILELLDLPAKANDIGSYDLAIDVMGNKAKRAKAINQIHEMIDKTEMAAQLRKL